MTTRQIRHRLILGTIAEYIIKIAAVCGAVYGVGWFGSWLCSLITMTALPFVFMLIMALGAGFIWFDTVNSIELTGEK